MPLRWYLAGTRSSSPLCARLACAAARSFPGRYRSGVAG